MGDGADGARLRRLREERALSLRQMAGLVHYSKGYLSKIETGDKPVSSRVVREYRRVLDARPAAPGATSPVAPVRSAPLCVGRERELAALADHAEGSAAGAFRVVWIGGEPGAGKNTLGAALTADLVDRGWSAARSAGIPGAPPGRSWVEVVEQLPTSGTEVGSDVGSAVPGIAAALARSARRRPVVIVLDDVTADRGTWPVLRHLFTELPDLPVLVLATYRTHGRTPELRAAQADLAGERSADLVLTGLDAAAVGVVLREVAGFRPHPAVIRRVAERSGGNPLFVSEIARLARAEGPHVAVRAVPTGVAHVLRHRLAALPAAGVAVLRGVAVLGPDADTETLLATVPGDPETVLDGLEAAVEAGLLVETGFDSVRFVHALLRDVIHDDLPRLRARRLRARALELLDGDRRVAARRAARVATVRFLGLEQAV